MQIEAADMADSPGGPSLLAAVGYVYEQEAKKHLGRFFGIESFFSKVAEQGHAIKEVASIYGSIAKLQVEMEKLQKYENEESKKKIENLGLSTLWKVGKLEIESVIRMVCEGILTDKTMEKSLLKKRGKALLALGEVYSKVAKEATKSQGKEDPAEFISKLAAGEKRY